MARGYRDEDDSRRDDDDESSSSGGGEPVVVAKLAIIVKETDKAVLAKSGEFARRNSRLEIWLPKRAIHPDSTIWSLENKGPGTLIVMRWWFDQHEWT